MLIGYARTSTVDQAAGLAAQERDLRNAGATKQFVEQVSSIGSREQLHLALDYVREDDTLVVTRLDRLARSTSDLLSIVDTLERKCVGLRVLDFGGSEIDTSSPTGRLVLTMFGAMAQFERELMLQRQREGIAKAKAAGKYKGRQPTARSKASEVFALVAEGFGASEIGEKLNISRASVYRILADRSGENRQSNVRSYNGFSKAAREAAARIVDKAILSGEAAEPTHCEICGIGAEARRIYRHLEDYREPLNFHGLCSKCHHALHTRFWEPGKWFALIDGKQKSWFHELSLDEMSRRRPFDETYPSGVSCDGRKVSPVPPQHIPSTEWALRGVEVGESGDERRNGVPQGTRTKQNTITSL